MKKDRNCGMNVYPNMMPVIMPGQMIPMNEMQMNQNNYATDSLSNQINSLQQRISRLENIVNGSNYSSNYNTANYQMM